MIYFKAVSKLALLLITLLSLTGCDYPPPPTVTPVGCIPSPLGTQFADVTGDGKADAIAINVGTAGAPPAGITVRRSDGSKFLANESWTTGPFSGGTLGTYFADVNGDGKADEIEVNSDGEYVRLSTGSSFDPAVKWSDPVYDGIQGTYFADVNGDGKADIIAVKSDGVYVGLSTGSSFGPSVNWTNGAYYGSGNTQGAYFADVTGDGKADAIVDNFDPTTNTGGITVRRSDGTQFLDIESWITNPYYGNVGTYFADVTGGGNADAITVNTSGVTVRRSDGTQFLGIESWITGPFYGDYHANCIQ